MCTYIYIFWSELMKVKGVKWSSLFLPVILKSELINLKCLTQVSVGYAEIASGRQASEVKVQAPLSPVGLDFLLTFLFA